MEETVFRIIARIHSAFPTKFGIPRQSNMVPGLKSFLVFEPEYRSAEAVRGLEAVSHLWLIWEFSENRRETWSSTVRPPRLGGNMRMGVFATRSPFRPNNIGLSSVKLDHVELHPDLGPVLHISGADLLDGTPILDIKPYIPYSDCHPEAVAGFATMAPEPLTVVMGKGTDLLSPQQEQTLREVLAQDPRPSYHHDPGRVYGMRFAEWEVKFSVDAEVLTVQDILLYEKNPHANGGAGKIPGRGV